MLEVQGIVVRAWAGLPGGFPDYSTVYDIRLKNVQGLCAVLEMILVCRVDVASAVWLSNAAASTLLADTRNGPYFFFRTGLE